MSIKLNNIVTLCGIDERRALYVLAHRVLSKMPKAGTKGIHRQFSLEQARRLAIASLLVQAGISRHMVARTVNYCETTIKRLGKPRNSCVYASTTNDPWTLRIVDGRYVRLWREQLARDSDFFDDDEHLDLKKGNYHIAVYGLLTIEIDLTQLEHRLAAVGQASKQ